MQNQLPNSLATFLENRWGREVFFYFFYCGKMRWERCLFLFFLQVKFVTTNGHGFVNLHSNHYFFKGVAFVPSNSDWNITIFSTHLEKFQVPPKSNAPVLMEFNKSPIEHTSKKILTLFHRRTTLDSGWIITDNWN